MDYYFACPGNPSSSSCGSSSFKTMNNTTINSNINHSNNKEKKSKCGSKKSKGVMKLSTDPQSVAARERRHRISDRFKILQSLIPGGTKLDTASMLEEAINYVKFLKNQIWLHQNMINFVDDDPTLFLPPDSLPIQESNVYNSNVNFVDDYGQPSLPMTLPDSCFQIQSEDAMHFDVNKNYY